MPPYKKDNLSFELLELLASEHAPPGGSVLFKTRGKDLRLVRHAGEPLTVEYCHGLLTAKAGESSVASLPGRIVTGIFEADHSLRHLPTMSKLAATQAVVSSMKRDAVDYHRSTLTHKR